jgi:GTP cyclohydrolase I
MRDLVRQLLESLGEDPSREGLIETPRRVEKSLAFLTSGYRANVDEIINGALFTVSYNEMVMVRDIDMYSLCEHHLLPFFGKCHVAYIPDGRVIGLSKIPRIVDAFARRLQVQERLTTQVAETLRRSCGRSPSCSPRSAKIRTARGCARPRGASTRSLTFLTSGYRADIDEIVNGALFTVEYNEMVMVRDIDVYSLCEHHLLPFFGKCHVAYIPDGRVIGLSKIPRIVDVVRAPAAGAGTSDDADCRDAGGEAASAGSGGRHGGDAPLHGDARCREAEFGDGHERDARCVPSGSPHPRRIPRAHSPRWARRSVRRVSGGGDDSESI